MTRLHLPHAIVVGLHVRKINVVVLTPETVGTVGVWAVGCSSPRVLVILHVFKLSAMIQALAAHRYHEETYINLLCSYDRDEEVDTFLEYRFCNRRLLLWGLFKGILSRMAPLLNLQENFNLYTCTDYQDFTAWGVHGGFRVLEKLTPEVILEITSYTKPFS